MPRRCEQAHVAGIRCSVSVSSQRLATKPPTKLFGDIDRLVEMGIDPQCRLEGLQSSLQIAGSHIDHAKSAERAEMTWLEFHHTGNVTT